MYAIESPLPGNTTMPSRHLVGLKQKLFRISQTGYARNAIEGLFRRQPLQARLYKSSHMAQTLAWDVNQGSIDVIIAHLVRTAEYARPFKTIPRILDMTDSIHLHYARMPRLSFRPQGLATFIERKRLDHYEAEVSSWFNSVLLASPLDIAWLTTRKPSTSNLALVPTGIETSSYQFYEGPFDPNRIIFVGKLDYMPNADAAAYFARDILPLIQRAVPSAEFVVAGWNPPRTVRKLARSLRKPESRESAQATHPVRLAV